MPLGKNDFTFQEWQPLMALIPQIEKSSVFGIMADDENFDFDTVDISVKCKLITAIMCNDRFCEGALG
jgi:hypothetical protein